MSIIERTTIRDDTAFRHTRKYESRNPLHRCILGRFHRRVSDWLRETGAARVLDFGCGEGYFWRALSAHGPLPDVVGLDLRREAIEAARASLPSFTFIEGDLFQFDPAGRAFDLVIASEVLEHLYDPGAHLARLCELASGRVLLTVPHEPFFRLCNLARGRDISRLGDHPEHVQHWSARGFARFASRYLVVERIERVFPFLLLLGRPRS